MQAHTIATETLDSPTNAELLVDEYMSAIAGHNFPTGAQQDNKRNTVMFVQKLWLQEFRPWWLTYKFPQALPGDAILSRFTRPSFLFWPEGQTEAPSGAVPSLGSRPACSEGGRLR